MEELESSERRQFPRVKHSEAVQYQSKDLTLQGGSLASDISEGGIRLNVNGFIPLHTELALSIQLTTEKIVECLARVVWVEKVPYAERYQAGLRFDGTATTFESQRAIQGFLQASPF